MTALLDVDQLRTFIAGARSPLWVRSGERLRGWLTTKVRCIHTRDRTSAAEPADVG